MSEIKKAMTDHRIQDTIAERWSPYLYDENRDISPADLRSIFEATRWAASAFNEQPWRYIVATRNNRAEFDKVLSCLVEANQAWARRASVLALGLTRMTYTHNDKPNGTAHHDLGLASATLTLEATSRGIKVHQMGGILPDKAREIFQVPDEYEVLTGVALGYLGTGEGDLAKRDATPRTRKTQDEFVFGGMFGQALTD